MKKRIFKTTRGIMVRTIDIPIEEGILVCVDVGCKEVWYCDEANEYWGVDELVKNEPYETDYNIIGGTLDDIVKYLNSLDSAEPIVLTGESKILAPLLDSVTIM